MLAEMAPWQFAEWVAYARIEPFGSIRGDTRAGTIAAAVRNAAPFRSKDAHWFEPKDFFASLHEPRRAKKPEELIAAAKIANVAMGGKFE